MFQKIALIINILFLFSCSESFFIEVDKMEIVEIVTQKDINVGQFTVNTGVDFVPITYIPGNYGNLSNADGNSFIESGDNFEILSLGFTLPLSFEVYKTESGTPMDVPRIKLGWKAAAGLVVPLSNPAQYYLPLANYEYAIGKFVNKVTTGKKIFCASFVDTVYVSMVGVPTQLNGKTFSAPIFMKIKHNVKMVD